MTDREMLELAAKAAGIDGVWHEKWRCLVYMGAPPFVGGVIHHTWSPLTDDGDALRLAVQCGLEVSFVDDESGREGLDIRACVGFPASTERPCRIKYVFEDHRGDIFAATRRAIVRAAAEIGRQHD